MTLESLPRIVTLLIALSVAAERAVEILKGLVPWLDTARPEPISEGRRRAALQGLAAVAGIAVSYLTWPVVAQLVVTTNGPAPPGVHWPTILALGLLASGG